MISKTLLVFLSSWIIENTEFSKKIDDPEFFKLSKKEILSGIKEIKRSHKKKIIFNDELLCLV